jgi:3-hydroxybutyryl-CoA dehydrogenase
MSADTPGHALSAVASNVISFDRRHFGDDRTFDGATVAEGGVKEIMEIRKVAVIGAGTMGCGIAQAAAQGGYEVVLENTSEEFAKAGIARIKERLDRHVSEGKLEGSGRDRTLSSIRASARLSDCRGADLVIEAVIEKEAVKKEIFAQLDSICSETAIFATNTSSVSITRLARSVKRPDRFVGMHFMNPAHIMKLVEIIRGVRTSEETVGAVRAAAEKMGKTPVVVDDFPGFVSNRVLMPMINEAIFCLQEGVADKESIDTIMKLGANHPMGPLELADFIGLDTCLEILDILNAEIGEKFRPCPLLRKMVAAGRLGKKSGEGFYEYR